MANDNFYGYKRNPKKVKTKTGMRGSVDLDFESVNPYEFKKGMNAELSKMGTELRESSEEQREKATETIIKIYKKLLLTIHLWNTMILLLEICKVENLLLMHF